MTSPRSKSLPWEELPEKEAAELGRRALYLVELHGRKNPDAKPLWRRDSWIYETGILMLVHNERNLVVRVSGPVLGDGLYCFEMAYQKNYSDGKVMTHLHKGRKALEILRGLMVLDDLANA